MNKSLLLLLRLLLRRLLQLRRLRLLLVQQQLFLLRLWRLQPLVPTRHPFGAHHCTRC